MVAIKQELVSSCRSGNTASLQWLLQRVDTLRAARASGGTGSAAGGTEGAADGVAVRAGEGGGEGVAAAIRALGPCLVDENGMSLLQYACLCGREDAARLLLERLVRNSVEALVDNPGHSRGTDGKICSGTFAQASSLQQPHTVTHDPATAYLPLYPWY